MANIELLKKVRDKITSDPDHWDQTHWGTRPVPQEANTVADVEISCETRACIAGWACMLSGENLDWRSRERDWRTGTLISVTKTVNGDEIETRAAELLELNDIEIGELFHSYNNDDAMERLTYLIENGNLDEFYSQSDY